MSVAVEGRPRVDVATSVRADDLAIRCRDLGKQYRIEKVVKATPHRSLLAPFRWLFGRTRPGNPATTFWALENVSFEAAHGERVAIIGRNGSGKTTLLKILARISPPTQGEARIRGRVTALLGVGAGFNNALTGRENITVNATMFGLTTREIDERFDEIVEFSGIDPKFVDMRVKHYSTGMRARLAFSVAAHLDPDILMLDEVLSTGDLAFQEKSLGRMERMVRGQRTVLFVSHNLNAVTEFCERAIWLEQGRIVMDGPALEVCAAYREKMRGAVTAHRWSGEAVNRRTQHPIPTDPGEPEVATLGPDGTAHEPPCAELLSACVIDADRREVKAVTSDTRCGIELVYDVLRDGKVVLPGAHLRTHDGVHAFSALYTEPEWMTRPKARGRYSSVLWIPAHLLNLGHYDIDVWLVTPSSGKLERHAVLPGALGVDVYEAPSGRPSARGPYRDVKGAVRPRLDCETRVVEPE